MSDIGRAKELRAERAKLAEQMRAILDEPAGDDGLLNAEQEQRFDALHARQEELHGEITDLEARHESARERQERLEAIERDLKAGRGTRAGQQDTADLDRDTRDIDEPEDAEARAKQAREAYGRAFESYLRHGPAFMEAEERQVLRANFMRGGGQVYTPESRVQTVAQDTKGGFLVPQGMMQPVTEALKRFGGIRRSRAEVITTSDGRPIPWPTDDDTSNTGRLLSEAKPRSSTDIVFGEAVLNAYGYSSDFIKISFELLQDAEMDIVGMIGNRAGKRIGRITSTHMTTGDGASKPYGVASQAPSGVTAASATDVAWDELLDLKHSVDPDYREMAQWMFNDTTLKELKKLKDGDGLPLWQAGDVRTGDPNTIDGDPYVVNQQMDDTDSSTKPILYGDFSLYKIRDVTGMQLRRLDERFADDGQVGFILFSRHDGVLVDAGQGPVKALTMAA